MLSIRIVTMSRMPVLMCLYAAMGGTATAAVEQQGTGFPIAGQHVSPGQRMDIDLPVAAGASDPATYIPVTVFHGAQPGRVLAITAGVHGYEFPPILAAQELLSRIDPSRLRGTVILVRLANVAAFEERAPYVNPHDRKNLNRVFPGKADGTQAERIAWAITTEVIRRSDAHVELHSGDGAEWLEEFAGIYGGPLAADYDIAREIGLAFGLRNVVRYSMDTQQQIDSGRSLNRQAVADKKPTVLIEIGENGRRDARFVSAIVDGVINTLRSLKMMDGEPTPSRRDTRWFDSTASANAKTTGIFTPTATEGREVKKGELLGTVRDYSGKVVEEIVSPVDGYALYGLAGPPVKAGESVVTIGLPARGPL
jgi:predicted deacylase